MPDPTDMKAIAQRLQAIVGSEHPVISVDDGASGWLVETYVSANELLSLSHWPTMEEDDWSTGEHHVIHRPSARPYRVDSPRYSRGKTFARLDHARKALLHEAMAICLGGTPTPAVGSSGEAK